VIAPTLDDYRFDLPPELIAQVPAPMRAQARLMLVARGDGPRADHRIADLPSLLRGDELVVLNDTRVVPARLRGHKESGGRIELLAIGPAGEREFNAMGRSSKGFAPGMPLILDSGDRVVVTACLPDGLVRVRLPDGAPDLWPFLEAVGEIPLPPYIERAAGPTPEDRERYQTVFARAEGAVAAPTAGLHFTPELLAATRARGCELATVTLHVGLGTFMPIRASSLAEHVMHSERYAIPEATALAVARARTAGRPVLAVGTTVVRALESAAAAAADRDGTVQPGEAETRIFIREPYRFRVVDQLMTNFHLPGSTLLVMVAAFAGRRNILAAYAAAVAARYRFFSYGDGMLIR
jgi:S-adenosylmethionine:tRNA ribosyltransferase-isomerase